MAYTPSRISALLRFHYFSALHNVKVGPGKHTLNTGLVSHLNWNQSMTKKERRNWLFLILVITQGLHSIEEYIGKLWENFPPATVLCGWVSDDLEKGFLTINIGLFIFGLFCWSFLIRRNLSIAPMTIGFWIIIELINGVTHPIWSLYQGKYTPGVITAPMLLILALKLMKSFSEQTNTLR